MRAAYANEQCLPFLVVAWAQISPLRLSIISPQLINRDKAKFHVYKENNITRTRNEFRTTVIKTFK